MFKKIGCLICLLLSFEAYAVVPKHLDTPENREILKKTEELLNSFTTMKSRFTQFSSKDGNYLQHGDFYLFRPNRMRMVYDKPSDIQFIADGYYLIYYDKGFDQVSYLEIDQTPAAILLKPDFSFDEKAFLVKDISSELDEYRITAVKNGEEELGELTLIVEGEPLSLKQWELVDAKGIKSTVGLYETEKNLPLDSELFIFKKEN